MLKVISLEEVKQFPPGAELLVCLEGDLRWFMIDSHSEQGLYCRDGDGENHWYFEWGAYCQSSKDTKLFEYEDEWGWCVLLRVK